MAWNGHVLAGSPEVGSPSLARSSEHAALANSNLTRDPEPEPSSCVAHQIPDPREPCAVINVCCLKVSARVIGPAAKVTDQEMITHR